MLLYNGHIIHHKRHQSMNQNEISQKDIAGISKGHSGVSLSDTNTTSVKNNLVNTGEFFYSHKDNQTFFSFGKKAEKIITAIYMVTDFLKVMNH